MEMDDNKLKRLLQEGMDWDAECIMAEVNSDPELKDLIAPEEIHDNLMKQIRQREATLEEEHEHLSKEEQELIRLGKIYKKKRGRSKYIVLIAALVCALGVGTISFGDGKKVVQEIKNMIAGKTQINIDDSKNRTGETKRVSEDEAYEEINDKFGIWAVRMSYLPEGMEFLESVIDERMQAVRLYYDDSSEKRITYYIVTDYRTGSIGIDLEDEFVQEYEKVVHNRRINIQEYLIEGNGTRRYLVGFNEQEIQYWILLTGIDINEVEKIVDNLYFS